MNIFSVSPDPAICAEWLDDKRLNKMLTETAQLLSTTLRMQPNFVAGIVQPMKKAYYNHPCAIFTRANPDNYQYVLNLFEAYLHEWKYRRDAWHGTAYLLDLFKQTKITGSLLYEHPKLFHPSVSRSLDLNLGYQLTLLAKWPNDKVKPRWTKRLCPT